MRPSARSPSSAREDVDIHDNFFGTMETNEFSSDRRRQPGAVAAAALVQRVDPRQRLRPGDTTSPISSRAAPTIVFFDNVMDGVIEGDMRPFPPDPSRTASRRPARQSLLDAPVWATSARSDRKLQRPAPGNQTLTGTAGNDFLSGGSGDDTTIGGDGDDIHSIGSSRDVAVENAGEGVDTVRRLRQQLHARRQRREPDGRLRAAAAPITGNELDNIITGGAGNEYAYRQGRRRPVRALANGGNDRITDFAPAPGSRDTIDLRATSRVRDLADVLARPTQVGGRHA